MHKLELRLKGRLIQIANSDKKLQHKMQNLYLISC